MRGNSLVRIDKADWMRYLNWFRRTLKIPVRNDVRGSRGSNRRDRVLEALHLETPDGPRSMLTRESRAGDGIWKAAARGGCRTSSRVGLPSRRLGAHRGSDRFRSRLHADGAWRWWAAARRRTTTRRPRWNTAPAFVEMFIRREAIALVNPFRALGVVGVLAQFRRISNDATRWRFMHRLLSFPMPPPQDSVDRVMRHANVSVRFGTPVLDAVPGIRLRTKSGWHETDFLILGTGFTVDLHARPELSAIADHVATWSDRYHPPVDRLNAEMGRHPFVGSGFELLEKTPGTMPGLRRIRMFNGGSMVSTGPVSTGLERDAVRSAAVDQAHIVRFPARSGECSPGGFRNLRRTGRMGSGANRRRMEGDENQKRSTSKC
jgi:hypothetical protein